MKEDVRGNFSQGIFLFIWQRTEIHVVRHLSNSPAVKVMACMGIILARSRKYKVKTIKKNEKNL